MKNGFIKNKNTRKYLYVVFGAGMALLVARGVITEVEAPLWLDLAGAILGVGVSGVALANLDKGSSDEGDSE